MSHYKIFNLDSNYLRKKRSLVFFFFIIFIISCSEDDEIEQSEGTQLISIEYGNKNEGWVVNYYYSSNDEIIKIEDLSSLGRRYEIDYQDSRLIEYKTYRMDNDSLIFRDSILYNSNGTIKAIHNYSINSGTDLPLSWIYRYEYNSENKVTKKSTYFVRSQKYTSIEKFYWSGNNIERVEHLNEEEKLKYEYFFEYDDKENYQRVLPTIISDPLTWSQNNVTKINWNDYLGNLDLNCRPCIIEYRYNLDDYPVSIKSNGGLQLKLNYK